MASGHECAAGRTRVRANEPVQVRRFLLISFIIPVIGYLWGINRVNRVGKGLIMLLVTSLLNSALVMLTDAGDAALAAWSVPLSEDLAVGLFMAATVISTAAQVLVLVLFMRRWAAEWNAACAGDPGRAPRPASAARLVLVSILVPGMYLWAIWRVNRAGKGMALLLLLAPAGLIASAFSDMDALYDTGLLDEAWPMLAAVAVSVAAPMALQAYFVARWTGQWNRMCAVAGS